MSVAAARKRSSSSQHNNMIAAWLNNHNNGSSLRDVNQHHHAAINCQARHKHTLVRRPISVTRRKLLSLHHFIALLLLQLILMIQLISSFKIIPVSNSLRWPIIQHNTAARSSIRSTSTIIYASSFPQHDHYDEHNDSSNSSDNNNINPQFYRQNYNRFGSIGNSPDVDAPSFNDRQRMIMNAMNNQHDDDEWESYLNLDLGDYDNIDYDGDPSIYGADLPIVLPSLNGGDIAAVSSAGQSNGGDQSSAISSGVDQDSHDAINSNAKNGEGPPREQQQQQKQSRGSNSKDSQSIIKDETGDSKPPMPERNDEEVGFSSKIDGDGKILAAKIEGQEMLRNKEPIPAAKSSLDAQAFRQQFVSRTKNDNANGQNDDNSMIAQASAAATTPSSTSSSAKRTNRRITTEEIEHIKSTIPLTDVVETYNLKGFTRTNTHTAKACCPFHDDNNPSMSIDDNRGLYKCFACGAGGDVFNFIREYDYLENKQRVGGEKMGYMQAVEYAAREFGDDRLVSNWNFGKSSGRMSFEGMSEETKEKMMEKQRKKERIRQANTAAAAFYTKCLVTLSTAGKARAHLRSRNISPESVREFALGYAPDCYYGDEASSSSTWGEGSLVNYLAEMEFTPDEIVEAGLAVRTKKKKFNMEDGNPQTNGTDDTAHDYSSLMDRFRSRLIIPILDDNGEHVIAFGGRHLERVIPSDNTKDDFTPAKYINSPDSLVFTKKNILFNKNKAQDVLRIDIAKASESSSLIKSDSPKGVVIVEGYFDAIALSNVGVKNVVASMGTALPPEQLQMAAEISRVPGGRIILCMDGDEAGQNAVARLSSSSSVLSKSSEINLNELYVATLPNEIKDPSDFVDYAGGGDNAKRQFEEDVLDKAIPWNDWYIERILSKYDTSAEDGTKCSFSGICDEVSTFLATLTSPADRTRRVYKIAEKLVDLIAPISEKNSTSSSMMRVQLEADILNMATRKAGVREAMARRIEQADGISGDVAAATMEKLTSGGSADEENRTMSTRALARVKTPQKNQIPSPRPRKPDTANIRPKNWSTPRKLKRRKVDPPERHFVPHFNGFTFDHKTDRDWLGLTNDRNNKMHLGSQSSPFIQSTKYKSTRKQDVVYFNSNRYFGQQFLTAEAIQAGYTNDNDAPSSDESIADFMNRRILTRDADQMIEQAERRLLHALAKFPQARAAMRTVYSASTFGPKNMRWTSQERAWLFLCLTGSPEFDTVPSELLDGGSSSQLLSHLSQRLDCPEGAFNTKTLPSTNDSDFFGSDNLYDATDGSSVGSTPPSDGTMVENELDSILEPSQTEPTAQGEAGILDEFFVDDHDLFPSFSNSKIAKETRAELTVQETVAALLRATAMKRFSTAKIALSEIVEEMDRRGNTEGDTDMPDDSDLGMMPSEELEEMFIKVGSEVVSAQKSLYEAERSCDRVNSHLLDYSVSSGVQYKLSQASVERLNKMMEEHIASLPDDTHRPDKPGNDEAYVFGSDEFDEHIDSQFGGSRPDVFDPRMPT